ncbi:MAG: helix-turn-helix domain-containing protein, partial [Gracilibacteraceae bacterium]|nr:helix-turn-helix domain-containing protein [Gracilibacteraceae bacterium]
MQANDKEICGKRMYPQYEDQSSIVGKRRQAQKWLTPEEVKQIVIAYQNGANIYELGDQYNCDRQTISRNLKKQGVNVTTEKLTSETDIQNLIKLYTDGLNTL